jgi:hypothetical protein
MQDSFENVSKKVGNIIASVLNGLNDFSQTTFRLVHPKQLVRPK